MVASLALGHDVNLSHSNLAKSVFTQNFGPISTAPNAFKVDFWAAVKP